jgi:hypothetical protein
MEVRPPADVTEHGVGRAGKRARELVGFLCCSGVLPGPDLLHRAMSFTPIASSTSGNPLQKQWHDRLEDQ